MTVNIFKLGGVFNMSKKKVTNNPTKKDLRIMHYMSKVGGISHHALLTRFGYHQKTIDNRFSKLSYIQKNLEEETLEDGRVVKRYIYSLNKQGKDLMLKHNLNHHCCSYNGYIHTLKAEQKLFDMVGRDEMFDKKKSLEEAPVGVVALENIEGEAEQKFKHEAVIELLRDEGKEISVVDFIYKKDGEVYAVEVETENYRKGRREAHANYVKLVLETTNYETC